MLNNLLLIYQDCPDCERYKSWYDKQSNLAHDNNITIERFPYYQRGAAKLIKAAAKSGVTLPCFTDGNKFSKKIADFVQKDSDNRMDDIKPKRKTRRKKKEVKDGDNTDD